jgi:hypothetical protein
MRCSVDLQLACLTIIGPLLVFGVLSTGALTGNPHLLAIAKFDRGPVPASLPMERMLLVLTRREEREKALRKLMAQQLDRASPNFHKWLTPEQLGREFGPEQSDIRMVVSWLESHGFRVTEVSQGRMLIPRLCTGSEQA